MRNRIKRILVIFYKIVFYFFSFLPKNKKLVVFESFLGKQYSDNPRAIYEFMKLHYPDYDMYWSVDKKFAKNFIHHDIKCINRLSIKWLLVMTRAKYWVVNSRLPLWIRKSNNTVYVQTWHGTPLKRLALDMDEVHMPGTNAADYKKNFLKDSNKWDYLVSPNAYSSKIFKRAFDFHKSLIESGYPRNDFLVHSNNDDTIDKLKSKLHLPLDKKIILYAPTWRDNQFYKKGQYKFDLQLDFEKFKNSLGDNYVVLLRLHYLVAEKLDLSEYEHFVYDFSNYEDIRDLYLVSDLLITDYSSVFFDYAILNRPILFYTYDIEEYRDHLRGFYFDFETGAPGPILKTTDEVIASIIKLENTVFQQNNERVNFNNQFCYLEDGCATERVVNKIFLRS
jgi:CDP-glycerol glycerophosphotransferase